MYIFSSFNLGLQLQASVFGYFDKKFGKFERIFSLIPKFSRINWVVSLCMEMILCFHLGLLCSCISPQLPCCIQLVWYDFNKHLFFQYLVFVCCLTYICIQYLALVWYGPVVKFFKTFPLQTLTELDNYELLIFIILHAYST